MTIKAVRFDHDGTLVDSELIHYHLWRDLLRAHAVELSLQDYQREYAGVPAGQNAIDLCQRFGLPLTPASLVEGKVRLTVEYLARQPFPLMPGVLETINSLQQQGLRMAVVTGAQREALEASQQHHPVFRHFACMICGNDVEHSKPAPDVYLLALQRLGLQADACVAIEDTETGVRAASAAGLACLAVPTELSLHHDFSLARACFPSMQEACLWLLSCV